MLILHILDWLSFSYLLRKTRRLFDQVEREKQARDEAWQYMTHPERQCYFTEHTKKQARFAKEKAALEYVYYAELIENIKREREITCLLIQRSSFSRFLRRLRW